jgi:hypothetical protein
MRDLLATRGVNAFNTELSKQWPSGLQGPREGRGEKNSAARFATEHKFITNTKKHLLVRVPMLKLR